MYPYKLYIILISILTIVFCSNEKLIYNANIKHLPAGSAIIKKENRPHADSLFTIFFNLKTNKIFDLIYKVRDQIRLKINPEDYSVISIFKNTQQGTRVNKQRTTIDYENSLIKFKKDTLQIKNKIYDPLSIIYFLRNQDLALDKKFHFKSFNRGKVRDITLKVFDEKIITTSFGRLNCFGIMPTEEKAFKTKGAMNLWITADSLHLPIIIEKYSKNGLIKLTLKEYIYE